MEEQADMPKTLLSPEELKDRAFQAIKRCEGCDDVYVGPGAASAANRAAVLVEYELRSAMNSRRFMSDPKPKKQHLNS